MRFLSLSLLAYGPFTNLVLDFASPSPGLHVLYGTNEAGKSTTLRAIMGLLYGIPKNTPDAHLHKMPDLRVGARLAGAEGAVLDIVRRKGTVNTLLDPSGNPADEGALRKLLGNVGEELFGVMFGLNHETLRQGAEALLRGKGNLGESLFGAGLGQSGLHEVLEELQREAEEIFTQKARVRPLNDALRSFSEAQKKARDLSLSSEAWLKQKQGIEEAIEDQRRLAEDARRLQAQKSRLRRAKLALPLLAKRKQLKEKLAALAHVVRLPEDAARNREDARRRAAEAATRAERLALEIRDLEARRAELVIPRSLLEQGDAIEDIQGRLGSHRKALVDLPRLRGELHQLKQEARTVLRRLGRDVPLEGVEALRVDAAAQARIKKLALQPEALREKLRGAERAAADVAAKIEAQRARLAALPPAKDVGALRREVARAQRQGDLEARLRKASGEHRRLEETAAGRLAALGLWSGPLVSVAALPLPPIESVDAAEQTRSALAKQMDLGDREAEAIEKRKVELDRGIDEITRGGAVPLEEELAAARARRDEGWERIRRAWRDGRDPGLVDAGFDPDRPLPEAYEESAARADAISDRLRREAARVAKLAALLADRDAGARRAEALKAERHSLELRLKKADEAFRKLFRPAGIDPLSPAEMRGWLARHASLVAQAEQLHAVELERDALRRQIDEHRADLGAALEEAGERGAGDPPEAPGAPASRRGGEDLASLIERAARVVASIESAAREREDLDQSIQVLLKDQERLAREAAARAQDLAAWKEAWARGVVALGLSEEASPEEATAILDELGDLFRKVDEIKKTQRRVDLMVEEAEQFEGDVAALVSSHAADLEGVAADQAAAQLLKRYQQGTADMAERGQIDQQLRDKRREQGEQQKAKAAADERLAELMRAARAESIDELEAAELQSREAQSLEAQAADVENRLLELGEGATIEMLIEEVSGMDADRLAVELDEIDLRITAMEDHRAQQDRRLGSLQAGLDQLGGASKAVEAAADAQESLARIRALVERYLRARIAALILDREIERYRERNQGPILTRASELFRILTRGAYTGLRAGYDEKDQPVLRCVRAGGSDDGVGVEGLSDGTRDQLFLALRLASLERYTETNEPMPLIVDDILIHFDDERSRAALEALGALAERTQVLFFTHHARLVELARQAVPAERLKEHRLRALSAADPLAETLRGS
jgi:uncharacterized protein YhaN